MPVRIRRSGIVPALLALPVLLLVLFLAGCGPRAVPDEALLSQGTLIWPSPPAPARISYIRSISRAKDIGAKKGLFKRLLEALLGSAANNIIKPYGVTVDSEGRLIVVDTALKRIHIFDINNNKYRFIEDAGRSLLVSPIAAAVDSLDNIYVTDPIAGKVFVYNKDGRYLFDIDAGQRPTGIAINRELGYLYVVDTGSHHVRVLDLKGKEIKRFGSPGSGEGQFNFPVDIFLDRRGDVYVTDTMNYKIQIFDKDGKFLTRFGRQGDGTGDFGRLKGVAVDGEGNIYVADAIFDTVQIFNREGRFLLNFGALGSFRGAFWMPAGVFIDRGDRIYVADSYNKRVQIFEYLGDGDRERGGMNEGQRKDVRLK